MPALLLLGQPVGVLARQRADEPGLAVVDMAGRSDGQRHRASINPSSIAHRLEAPGGEQRAPLRLVALAAGEEREHEQVEPLRPVRLVSRPETVSSTSSRAPAAAAACGSSSRIARRALVVPVVQDRREDVDVALAGRARRSLPATKVQRSPSASSSRVVSGRSKTTPRRLGCRAGARRAGIRCRRRRRRRSRRPASRRAASRSTLRSLPCSIARSNAAAPPGRAASQHQKSVPNIRGKDGSDGRASSSPAARCQTPPKRCAKSSQPSPAEQLGRVGVPKDARLLLGEDPLARERAQDAVQRVGVGADLPRDVLDGTRAVRRAPRRHRGRRRARAPAHRARREGDPRAGLRARPRSRVDATTARGGTAAATSSDLSVRERAAVEEQPAVAHDPDHGRLAAAKRLGQLELERRRRSSRSPSTGSAPPPGRARRLLDGPAGERGEPLGTGTHHLDRLREHAQNGDRSRLPAR